MRHPVVGQDRIDIEVDGGEQRTGGMLGILNRPLETMPVPNVANIAKDQTYQAKPGIRPMDMLRERRTRRVGDVMENLPSSEVRCISCTEVTRGAA